MKKGSDALVLSPIWQKLFIGTVIGGWAVEQGMVLRGITRFYTGAGTWTFQASVWTLPFVFFASSLVYARRRYPGRLQRISFASLLTTMAMSVYGAIYAVEEDWYATYYTRHHPVTGNSYWQIFGNVWIVMAASLALFVGLLLLLRKKA